CNLCHLDRTLAWAGEALEKWYGAPSTQKLRGGRGLTPDERSIAAGVPRLTRGGARPRASAPRPPPRDPARAPPGPARTAPYLAQLLADPYAAVRYLANRALRRLPDFSSFECDYTVPGPQLAAARARALDTWSRTTPPERRPKRDELLIDPAGRLELERL